MRMRVSLLPAVYLLYRHVECMHVPRSWGRMGDFVHLSLSATASESVSPQVLVIASSTDSPHISDLSTCVCVYCTYRAYCTYLPPPKSCAQRGTTAEKSPVQCNEASSTIPPRIPNKRQQKTKRREEKKKRLLLAKKKAWLGTRELFWMDGDRCCCLHPADIPTSQPSIHLDFRQKKKRIPPATLIICPSSFYYNHPPPPLTLTHTPPPLSQQQPTTITTTTTTAPPCRFTTVHNNPHHHHVPHVPPQVCHRLCKPAPPFPAPPSPPTSSAQPAAPVPSSAPYPLNTTDHHLHASPPPVPAPIRLAAQIRIPHGSPHNHS